MATDLDLYQPFDAGNGANVTEDNWRKMARMWLPNGVIAGEDSECSADGDGSGLLVKVQTGKLWLRGEYGENTSVKSIALSSVAGIAGGSSRYDRIVARMDPTLNKIQLDVLTGTPAATGTQVAPSLTQSASGIWEVSLCRTPALTNATTVINAAACLDERNFVGHGKEWVQISDILLSADGAITFSSIPQTYTHLMLITQLRAASANAIIDVGARFNGDTGANYDDEVIQGINAVAQSGTHTAATSVLFGTVPGNSATATRAGAAKAMIPNYRATTFQKNILGEGGISDGGASFGISVFHGSWRSTAAITQIDVWDKNAGANSWKAGSRATLMGLRT